MNLRDKLNSLKKTFKGEDPSSYDEIIGWGKDVDKFKMISRLGNTDAVREVIADFERVVSKCNTMLTTQRKMTESERAIIFEKRDNYQYFINLFQSAERNLEDLEKRVDDNLYEL